MQNRWTIPQFIVRALLCAIAIRSNILQIGRSSSISRFFWRGFAPGQKRRDKGSMVSRNPLLVNKLCFNSGFSLCFGS